MKKLLIFLVLVGFTQLSYSQSLIQTFTDRCTGETKVFSIAMQGTTTVVFYNKSRTFTAADVQSGVFQAWLEETYAWWLALSPCSTNQSSTTNTQTTTQQTTSNATAAASNATSSSASTANTGSTASTASTDTGSTASTDTGSTASTADTAGGTASSETTNTNTNDTSNTNSSSETGSTDQGSTGDSGSTDSSSSDTGSTDNSSDTSSGDTSSEGSTGDGDGSTSDSSGGSEGDSTEEGGTTGDGETSEGDSGETTEEGTGESESKSEDSKEGESSEEDSKSESKEEESKEEEVEESKEEESKEEESKEEESKEESEEEKQEEESEESDEESEEDTEEESDEEESDEEESDDEESDEEESDDEESEEEEEEDSEEENNNEEEEEDDKKKKKKRNLAPPIISANLMTMQMLDGTLSTAASFGISQSSLTGVETYSLNTMIWSNLKQFMIGGGVSTVYFRYDRKEPRMLIDPDTGEYHQFGYSMEKGSIWSIDSHNVNFMYMFGTKMVSYTYSQVYLGQKDNVWKGFVGGYAATNSIILLPESTMYSPSLTFFGTKPVTFKALKRWSFGPMVAVSLSPLQILNTKSEYNKDKVEFVWNKYFTYIIGTNANFNLTQRFAANLGINTINNTSIDIPTTFAVTIGARFAF